MLKMSSSGSSVQLFYKTLVGLLVVYSFINLLHPTSAAEVVAQPTEKQSNINKENAQVQQQQKGVVPPQPKLPVVCVNI